MQVEKNDYLTGLDEIAIIKNAEYSMIHRRLADTPTQPCYSVIIINIKHLALGY